MNQYDKRLLKEWIDHSKIIIAVDYDSTISYWQTIENHEDISKVINLLRVAQETGCYTVCFTACDPLRHQEIKDTFKKLGLKLDSINTNPIKLPYGEHGKIFYNILLDDRAGLNDACEILSRAMYAYRGMKINNGEDVG